MLRGKAHLRCGLDRPFDVISTRPRVEPGLRRPCLHACLIENSTLGCECCRGKEGQGQVLPNVCVGRDAGGAPHIAATHPNPTNFWVQPKSRPLCARNANPATDAPETARLRRAALQTWQMSVAVHAPGDAWMDPGLNCMETGMLLWYSLRAAHMASCDAQSTASSCHARYAGGIMVLAVYCTR